MLVFERFFAKLSLQKRIILRTVLVLLALFVVVALITAVSMADQYRTEIGQITRYQVRQIRESYDGIIGDAQTAAFSLAYQNEEFAGAVKNYRDDYYHRTTLMGRLERLVQGNPSIASAYLAIHGKGIVISSETGIFGPGDIFYDPVIAEMEQDSRYVRTLPQRRLTYLGNDRDYVTVLIPFPYPGEPKLGTLAVNIDVRRVYAGFLQRFNLDSAHTLTMADAQGRVLAQRSMDKLYEMAVPVKKAAGLPFFPSPTISAGETSAAGGVRFTLQFESTDLYLRWVPLRTLLVSLSFLFLAALGFLSLTVARTLAPFSRMVRGIAEEAAGAGDEVQRLAGYLNRLHQEKQSLTEQYRTLLPSYRRTFLQDLFSGRVTELGEIERRLLYNRIELPPGRYTALCVRVEQGSLEEKEFAILKTIVDDAMGQALGRAAVGVQPLGSHPTGFHVETEHDKLGLAVHEGAAVGETAVGETAVEQTGGDEERIVGAAQGIAEGILAALGDQALRDRVSIGVGAPAASLGELYRSYDGARRAVYYRPRREGRIISIWEIQTTANTAWTYPYPKERVLLNLMRSGNTEGSLRLVEDILDSLPAGAGTAQDELFFCQQLVHSLNRYAYEAGIGNQEGGLLRIDLSGDWNFSEARSRIRRAVEQIIAAELDTHNGGDSILDQVLAYIDTHAADRNLQLLDLETAFSYNRYYLSRLIKEKTGSQFNEYLNRKRLERAAKLLVETAYTVNEVAEKSGYSYAYYFIKVFKNHYGTTPNEYRSANRNHPRS